MTDIQVEGSRWLERHVATVRTHGGPVTFLGDLRWGANHIIPHVVKNARAPVWLALEPTDYDDPVRLGNKLADAFADTLGEALLQRGAPYAYNLSRLKRCNAALPPFYVAISDAHLHPKFVTDLSTSLKNKEAMMLTGVRALSLPNGLVLDKDMLVLTPSDVRDLAPWLPDAELAKLLFESDGALEDFFILAHQRYATSLPLRPTARGYWHLPSFETRVSLPKLLSGLIKSERWEEALEFAARTDPEWVSEVLTKSGSYFLAQGLYKQLWNALSQLDAIEDETTMLWLLTAARSLGKAGPVLKRAKHLLERRDAPELRAYCANLTSNVDIQMSETKRAVELKRSAFTLYQRGRTLSQTQPEDATEVLREAITLAEQDADVYSVVRNAWALAANQTLLGRYREAMTWAGWSLEQFKAGNLNNTQRWLLSANEWAFARILVGETAGLEGLLGEAESQLGDAAPQLAALVRGTLGDYWLSVRRPDKALTFYEANADLANLRDIGGDAIELVRALLELDKYDEAVNLAERAHYLSIDRAAAELCLGMAQIFSAPEVAQPHLRTAFDAYKSPLRAVQFARAGCYLALAHNRLGDVDIARQTIAKVQPYLDELGPSGYRYLIGLESAFSSLLQEESRKTLSLYLLGDTEVRLGGRVVSLTERELEVSAILALYPEGLTGEQLALHLYADEATANSVKSLISRLRKRIPVSLSPYRFEVATEADFIMVTQQLEDNQLASAASLYRGPLLAKTQSPRLLEEQRFLENSIKRAATQQRDVEALFQLASLGTDDLELWEHLLEVLPPVDARYPLALSRAQQVRTQFGL